uniref:Katanin p80 subunit C-terminal domain-containing protein n=1 Tax=Parascaris equorum TaxID=6256 RepID=A0A914RZ94_PAREQ
MDDVVLRALRSLALKPQQLLLYNEFDLPDIPVRRKWLSRGSFYVQVLADRSLYLPFSDVVMYIVEFRVEYIDAQKGAIEMPMEELSEQDIFMPTHTLPRTPPPQPLALPPSEETFIISMVNASSPPSQSRPNTLKTRRSEVNSKNNTKSTVASGSRIRRSLANNKSSNGPFLFVEEEKSKKGAMVVEELGTGSVDSCCDENAVLEEISKGHANVEVVLAQRRASLDSLRQCWRTRGIDAALTEAARFGEAALVGELLAALNHSPTTWNLSMCCAVLAHIGVLVASKHEHYVEIALTALRTAITGFGNVIRMGAQQPSHIGVDVTAEERHSKCVKCVQQLTEMRVKASLLCDRMNARHAR